MTRRLFTAALLIFLSAPLFSWVADFEGMTHAETAAFFTNSGSLRPDGAIIGVPYKLFTGKQKPDNGEWVYDFQDRGDRFQRGCVAGYYGDGASFSELAASLKSKGLKVYSKINVFFQPTGFNRSVWQSADFTDGQTGPERLLLINIRRPETAAKLRSILQELLKENVDEWLVDLRSIPDEYRSDYRSFLKNLMGNRVITIENEGGKGRLSSETYWKLRLKYFTPASPDFKGLITSEKPDRETLHWIESSSFSVDNTATMAYLLLMKTPVVIPVKLLSQTHSGLIRFIQDLPSPRLEALSANRLLVSGPGHVLAFNFSDQLAMWSIPPVDIPAGIYPAKEGGAFLYAGKKPGILIFPQAVVSFSARD